MQESKCKGSTEYPIKLLKQTKPNQTKTTSSDGILEEPLHHYDKCKARHSFSWECAGLFFEKWDQLLSSSNHQLASCFIYHLTPRVGGFKPSRRVVLSLVYCLPARSLPLSSSCQCFGVRIVSVAGAVLVCEPEYRACSQF